MKRAHREQVQGEILKDFAVANQASSIDNYERDLGRINLPLIFTMEHCRLSWKDRMAVADAILANNIAYTGMAKERDMMKMEGSAGAMLQSQQPEGDRRYVREKLAR